MDPPKFAEGTVVSGRYVLVRYLARGGMAEVWLATHEGLRCDVAIKFIDQRLVFDQSGAALERFRMEAQLSARLGARTRHIVAVQDAGEHEGRPYLVMEFVPGHTLEDEIEDKGPLDPERLASLLDQAADALSAAHALGVIHRDLKPSNLMLIDDPDGSTLLKVSDFGIAKALRSDLRLDRPKETTAGELVGSPAYMSPEQIDGRRDLDARTDLWSLATVCYEALTGRTCFDSGSISDLLITISLARYTPPSRVRADLPKALDAWFARAFAVDPADRFRSATEMAQAFRAALGPQRAKRPAAWVAAAGALLVVGVIGLAALAVHSSISGAAARPSASATLASVSALPEPPRPPVESPSTRVEASQSPRVEPAPGPTQKTSPPRTTPSALPSATAVVEKPPPVKKRIDPSEIQ